MSEVQLGQREDVIHVIDGESALSIELVPLREGVARAFLRLSPRNPRLSHDAVDRLAAELSRRPYRRILVQDTKKHFLERTLKGTPWKASRALSGNMAKKCSVTSTFELPADEELIDSSGSPPSIANTSEMAGISVNLGDRKAWAFFTEEGNQARIISEGERRQGMVIARNSEDISEAADCLVSYLVAAKKSWAVFSVDMGRFVRKFDPTLMIRMILDAPKGFDHKAVPVSSENKSEAIRLFSEYYDESLVQSRLRLRRFRADGHYSIHLVEGGFVITRVEGDSGLIYDIYVTPAREGHGLGNELMKCALTDFAGRVSQAYLHTSYPRAKRLYEKFGFRAVYSQLAIRLDELALERGSAG